MHHVIRTVVRKLIGWNSNRLGNYSSMKTVLLALDMMIDRCLSNVVHNQIDEGMNPEYFTPVT